MPYAQVRGLRLYYEDHGHGPPLVLIPGALGTAQSDFGPQLEQLPGLGVRVISFDPRGYGSSRPPRRVFPIDFYHQDAEDCVALMAHLGCESYAVGGWSDGAIIGLLLTLAHPRQVEKLVVWGGNAYISQEDIDGYEKTRTVSSWSPGCAKGWAPSTARNSRSCGRTGATPCRPCIKPGAMCVVGAWLRFSVRRLSCTARKTRSCRVFMPMFCTGALPARGVHLFPNGKHNIHLAYAEDMNRMIADFLTA